MKNSTYQAITNSLQKELEDLEEINSVTEEVKRISNKRNEPVTPSQISKLQPRYSIKYLHEVKQLTKDNRDPLRILQHALILTTDTIALLLDTKANSKTKAVPQYRYRPFIIEHKNVDAFINHLEQLLEHNEPFHFDFILRNDNKNSHATAVQVSYDGVSPRLFSSDASINRSNYPQIAKIAKAIQYGKERGIIPKRYLIQHHMNGTRQGTKYGCSIFSIFDLDLMSKRAKTGSQDNVLVANSNLTSFYNSLQFMYNGRLPVDSSMNYIDPEYHLLSQDTRTIANILNNNPENRFIINNFINNKKETLQEFKTKNSIKYAMIFDLAFNKFAYKCIKAALNRAYEIWRDGGEKKFDEVINSKKNWEGNNTSPSLPILKLLRDENGNYKEDEETWAKLETTIKSSPLTRVSMVQEAINFITSDRIAEGLKNLLPEEEQNLIKMKWTSERLHKTMDLIFGNSSVENLPPPRAPKSIFSKTGKSR